jgi:DNA-binding FadR family transcriptional regulator
LLQQRKLKVGDAIPKEIELAEALGVSRTVIREAMLRLRLMGLIESKKKKGAVITSPDVFAIMSKSMQPHILDEDTLKEIGERIDELSPHLIEAAINNEDGELIILGGLMSLENDNLL